MRVFDGLDGVICLQAVPAGFGLSVKDENVWESAHFWVLFSHIWRFAKEGQSKRRALPLQHRNQMIMWFQLNTYPDNFLITPNCWWFQPELTCWFQQRFLMGCYLCLIVCWFMAWVQALPPSSLPVIDACFSLAAGKSTVFSQAGKIKTHMGTSLTVLCVLPSTRTSRQFGLVTWGRIWPWLTKTLWDTACATSVCGHSQPTNFLSCFLPTYQSSLFS